MVKLKYMFFMRVKTAIELVVHRNTIVSCFTYLNAFYLDPSSLNFGDQSNTHILYERLCTCTLSKKYIIKTILYVCFYCRLWVWYLDHNLALSIIFSTERWSRSKIGLCYLYCVC